MLFISLSAFAQQKVTGLVVDESGEPAVGATVQVKGTTQNATITDLNGNFEITCLGDATLIISSIGFQATEVQVNNQTHLDVVLKTDDQALDEVVVTALGVKREKKSLGYALQEVKGEELLESREANVVNALSGKVAGLQVIRGSNGPAGSSKIVLRGNNSLTGDNQPLIVVDGVPVDNFTGASNNDFWNPSVDMGNGLGDFNPEDIASVSVLKGPAAAALYGSRAGNGVILITTKTGTKQQGLGITYNTSVGLNTVFTSPNLQDQFGQGSNGVFDPLGGSSWGPKIEGQTVEMWNKKKAPLQYYNNLKNFMQVGVDYSNSITFQQQISKGTSVYSSIAYGTNQDISPESELKRLNLVSRVVSNFGARDEWTTDFKIQYINTKVHNRPIGGNKGENYYSTLITMPGTVNVEDFSQGVNKYGNHIWYNPGQGLNPYWAYRYNINEDSRDRLLMTGSVKYKFTDWLNAELKAGTDIYTTNTETKLYGKGPLSPTGKFSLGKKTFNETNLSFLISAVKDDIIENIGVAATFGGNLMSRKNSGISSSAGELEVPNLFSLNNSKGNPGVGQEFSEHKINSLYGTFQLNYGKFIYVDFTGRNDWSSSLSSANRSFFYPSLSTSFVFSEVVSANWLTYGKVRASYATVGNDMGPYQLYNYYTIGKDPNGNTTAGTNNVLYNEDVKNELIKAYEVGLELKLLDNRVGFDLAFYKSNATNQLINIPINPFSGYKYKKINAGDIENKGFELMVNASPFRNENFSWDIVLNLSKNINTVVELAEDVTQYGLGGFENVRILAAAGERYGVIYGSKYARVEDENSPYFGKIIVDENGIPNADKKDHYLGNQQPDMLLGLTNTFTYKNISLSFSIDGQFGGKMFSATNHFLKKNGNSAVTVVDGERQDIVFDGVVDDGAGGYTENKKAISPENFWTGLSAKSNTNLGITEENLYDATNIRLRNIQVNYQLPRKWAQVVGSQGVKLGVSVNNVWMIKNNLNGVDPESVYATGSNATGFEQLSPPTVRSYFFNLSISF